MSEEGAFLDGIAAARADRTQLLVFADWLAERGDSREEFVRTHTLLLDMNGTEPEFAERDKVWNIWVREGPRPRTRRPWLGDRWLDALCRVCTTAEVAVYAEDGRAHGQPARLDVVEYGHTDHTSPGAEKSRTFYHGCELDFDRPFAFVVETLLVDLREDPFLTKGVKALPDCYPITRGHFWKTWRELTGALRTPLTFPDVTTDNHFLGAQYVCCDRNNWGMVAIHRDDYFALFWSA